MIEGKIWDYFILWLTEIVDLELELFVWEVGLGEDTDFWGVV